MRTVLYKKYGRGNTPPKTIFDEFFWIFEKRQEHSFNELSFENIMKLNENYDVPVDCYNNHTRMFNSYEDFLKYCKEKIR